MGKKLIVGKNDFASWCVQNNREDLLQEWDCDANQYPPTAKSYGSHYKAAWQCLACRNRWSATLKSRALLNAGCPKCGIEKVRAAQCRPKQSHNLSSFAIENQIEWILSEWDFEENKLSPHQVARSSSKYQATWKCSKCGHRWKLSPNARVKAASDGHIQVSECPMCLKEKQTSFPEQAIYYYVAKCLPDAINGDKGNIGMELDVYVPSLNTGIEYDGYAWHQKTENDLRKNALCRSKGIKLIRVREIGCPALEEDYFCSILHVEPNDRAALSRTINALCGLLDCPIDVDLNRDEPLIMALYQKNKHENSLGYLYPELAKEFHPTKNGTLSVYDINKKSARQVWWLCLECAHEWTAAVSSRTLGHGCPACSGRILVCGKNDLETWCKETSNEIILDEWDYEKNTLAPCEVTKKSPYMASWKCSRCNSTYDARVYNRANGCGCPVCAGKQVRSGVNDFETWCRCNGKEYLLAEWDEENEFLPSEVSHGSGKHALWICSICGHHWSATLDNRKKGKGCPDCGRAKRALANKMRGLEKRKEKGANSHEDTLLQDI